MPAHTDFAATRSPSRPYNGLHPHNLCDYMDCYSFTNRRGMEGVVGLVGWPIADSLPTSPINHRSGAYQGKSAGDRPTSTIELHYQPLCMCCVCLHVLFCLRSRSDAGWESYRRSDIVLPAVVACTSRPQGALHQLCCLYQGTCCRHLVYGRIYCNSTQV